MWKGQIKELLVSNTEEIIKILRKNINMDISHEQIKAWKNQILFLKENLKSFNENHYVIFEYELTSGKRPDAIIVTNKNIIILEFKTGSDAATNINVHLDQAEDYKNRILKYHVVSREENFNINSFVVFSNKDAKKINEVLNYENFSTSLANLLKDDAISNENFENWQSSVYEPIPKLLDAVSSVFTSEKLPDIFKNKANIKATMNFIEDCIENPKNKIQVIFVSGEPGSGKTLLGLSIVNKYKGKAKFLTGNGPLSKILIKKIDKATNEKIAGESVIQHLTYWIKSNENSVKKSGKPNLKENIFIFDEAQRAWNYEQNINKNRSEKSQPEQILNLLYKYSNFTEETLTLICLIGDGQEIHVGEELGIENWSISINKLNKPKNIKFKEKLYISASSNIAEHFDNIAINDKLYLNDYFRGYEEDKYPKWVEALLDWNVEKLKSLTLDLNRTRYSIYVTKELNIAKRYLKNRYSKHGNYGLFVNSSFGKYVNDAIKAKLKQVSEEDELYTFFSEGNNNLLQYATEFNSQGLEVDFEVFCFGGDFELSKGRWKVNNIRGEYDKELKLTMCKNKHRVLLTRCRDGIILWIPEIDQNVELYNSLKTIGVRELK